MKKIFMLLFVFLLVVNIFTYQNCYGYENSFAKKAFTTPKIKNTGEKWKVGFMDLSTFPLFGMIIYDTFEKLKQDGWITYDKLPFDRENCDGLEIFKWASNRDMGPYLEFDPDLLLYTDDVGEENMEKILKDRLAIKKDIDLLIVFSTTPGRMATSFDHDVNVLVFGSGNAVEGGIIKSIEDSGRDNVMAHMDSTRYKRQMRVFYDIFNFKRIGMVFEDDPVTRSYAAIDEYQVVADEKDFDIVLRHLEKPKTNDAKEWDEYYVKLKSEYEKMAEEDNIDVFLLNSAVVSHSEKLKDLLEPFYEAKIPVLSQVGGSDVRSGCLMSIILIESKSYASYIADSIAKVLNGVKPRDLQQEFISPPYLTINMDIADRIDYEPTFEMLLSAEEIYNEKNNK